MNQIKSPFLSVRQEFYWDTDELTGQISDEAVQQRKVVLRAARIRPETRGSLLWVITIDCILWAMLGGAIYWLELLGFWPWIRGWFR